jgi:hypothetical protein
MPQEFSPEELGIKPVREFTPEELGIGVAPTERTYGQAAVDTLGTLAKGFGNVVALPSQVGKLVGLEDYSIGKDTSKNIQDFGESLISDPIKQRKANVDALVQAAADKGVLEQAMVAFKETGKDPALLGDFLLETIPSLLLGGGVGKGLQLLGAGAKTVLGGVLGTNAVMQGADVGSQTYDEAYKYLLNQGVPEEQAKQKAREVAGPVALGSGALSVGSQFLPGARGLEKALLGVKGSTGRITGAIGTGLGESLGEGVEETGGKFLSNLGLQQINPEQSLTEGLGQTLGLSTLGGLAFGAPAGALRGRASENLESEKDLTGVLGDLRTSFGTTDMVAPQDLLKKVMSYGLNAREAENFIANQSASGNLNTVPVGDGIFYQIPEASLEDKKQEAVDAPDNYTPEFVQAAADLRKTLLPQLNKFGLKNVGLNILDSIEGGRADGYYANKVIGIALNGDNPMGVMRHESIHALRALDAFKPQEWNVLENKAKSEWVNKFIKETDLYNSYKDQYQQDKGTLEGFDDYINEEAIAEAFKYFDKNGAPPGAIGNIYYRLKQFFELLRNGFTGVGFDTTDKIFNRIEQGKAAPQTSEVIDETKYALNEKPYGIPQKIWDLHNKSVEAEEKASNYNYGSAKRNQTMAFRRLNNAVNAEFGESQAIPVLQKLSTIRSIEQAVKENDESALNNYKVAFPEEYNQVVNKPKTYSLTGKELTPKEKVEKARFTEKQLQGLIKNVGSRIAGMKSDETLDDVRKAVKKLQQYTAEGIQGKDWYENSAKAVLDAFNGDPILAEKFFQIIAITSGNTEVAANFTKTVNAWTQFAQGKPIKVGTEDTNKKVDALLNFGEDWGGRKTNTFYLNLMEAMEGTDSGKSTIDLHMARMIFGKDKPTDAQYQLAENMIRLLASKVDMLPRQVQAASWVTQKAKSLFEEYKTAKNKEGIPHDQLMMLAFEKAVGDYSHQVKANVKKLVATPALQETSEQIKSRTQNITGEVIPSVKVPMGQAEELNFKFKEKITKQIANSDDIQNIANALGINSKIRITVGSGGYASKVNPNLIVQLVNANKDSEVVKKDALRLAKAMSYVFKQDATPLFRADKNLLEEARMGVPSAQIGYKFKFDTAELTPTQQKAILKLLQSKLGADAGFTTKSKNELVIINYRGEDGKPFLTSDEEFQNGLAEIIQDISKISKIESQEIFGAESEYPYHDWQAESSGQSLISGLYNSKRERLDIQQRLDDISESFKSRLRDVVRESGAVPRFSLRRYGAVSGEPISFNAKQPEAQTYVGVHYSNAERASLDGSKSGTGIKGAEQKRLANSQDPRIKKRVYFYIPQTDTERYPNKEAGLGSFKHYQSFDNILGPGKEMARLYNESGAKEDNDMNLFESAVVNAGYDGYAAPNMGMMVILNQDSIPVNFDDTDKKFSLALGKVEPATFLVSDKEPNNTGNLAYMSTASTLPHRPIRLPIGTHDDISDRGFGANHILRRIEQKPSRRPPVVSREVLEDVILQVQNIGKNFTRIYKDGNGKFVLFNPLTNDQLIVAQRPDHYEVVTMYQAKGIPTTIGNPVWSGRNIQPPPAKEYLEKQRGISVKAGERGVTPNAVAVQVKKRRVISPQDIENSANETKKLSLKVREFSMDDLPTGMGRPPFVLRKGTEIYHGAHKAVAEQIKDSNSLHAKPKTKSGSGLLTEGDLIWFGDKKLAGGHSKSAVDILKVRAEEEEGKFRKKGQIFSTITDRDYRLLPRGKKLNDTEIDKINEYLKLPDYNKLKSGDDLMTAEHRGHRSTNSNTNRYYIENTGEMSNSLAQAVRALGYDGVYDSSGIAITAENGIRLGDAETPMQRYSLKAPQTPAFKRWFGSSRIVNPDGSPKVMYHGTARDIEVFKPKQANAIFVTEDPDFAESFADSSKDYILKNDVRELWNDLTAKEQYDLEVKALKQAKKDGVVNASRAKEIQSGLYENVHSTWGFVAGELQDYIAGNLGLNITANENIMPLFIKAENPFDYENPNHINRLSMIFGEDDAMMEEIENGNWDVIESENVQENLRDMGYDGFYVREGYQKNLAVYDSSQLKSATGNRGTYDITSPNISYSLKRLTKLDPAMTGGQKVMQNVNSAFKQFQEDGYWTKLRNSWVDSGSSLTKSLAELPVFDSKGQLRADMLVRINSQMINIVRTGMLSGTPYINKDGSVAIERNENNLARSYVLADELDKKPSVKALGISGRLLTSEVARIKRGEQIMKEDRITRAKGLKKVADAKIEMKNARAFLIAGEKINANKAIQKARKLRLEGNREKKVKRELQVTQAHIDWANKQLVKVPELNQIFNIWNNVNNSLVTFWEDAGLLSKEKAEEYRSDTSYVPLYKSLEDLDVESFFRGTGLKSTKELKRLKGSMATRNIWENMERHYASMVSMGYQNQIRRVAVNQLADLGLAQKNVKNSEEVNLKYKENGKEVNAIVENPNDLTAFEMMHHEMGGIMQILSGSSRLLRAGALINPYYWIKQLIRDPLHANLTTTSGMISPLHSGKEFVSILLGNSKEAQLLASRGVGGAIDSTVTIQEFLRQSGQEKMSPSLLDKAISKVMKAHEASDSATRVAIYKKALIQAKEKGFSGEDAINFAVHKARESINFSVHGNSSALNFIRQSVPFFSAQITSLDTVYRAATGYGLNAKEKAEAIRTFRTRALMMALLSVGYAIAIQGDPDYEDLPDYVKDDNWLIPSPTGQGFIRIPIPFEVGFFFKTIPEALVRYMYGTSTGKEVVASVQAGIIKSAPAGFVPLPQVTKPFIESYTGFSFFTGRSIEGMSDKGLPVSMRGERASEFSKMLSRHGLDNIGMSPALLDNFIQGFTANLGTYVVAVADSLIDMATGRVPPATNLESSTILKPFMTDPNVSKAVADFYSLQNSARESTQEFKYYEERGDIESIQKFIDNPKKIARLNATPDLRDIGQELTEINRAIRYYTSNKESGTPEERRDRINELTAIKKQIAKYGYKVAEGTGMAR